MGDTYVRVSGAARKVADAYRKVGGVWVPATELHSVVPALHQSKQVFNAEVVVPAQANGLQSLSDIFNAQQSGLWASTKRKRLLVNLARGPLLLDSDFGGELTIEVVSGGMVSGNGGAGSTEVGVAGSAGGAAINVLSDVTKKALLVNNGVIRGGGGGGGKGGTGGQGGAGSYGYTAQEGPLFQQNVYSFDRYIGASGNGSAVFNKIIWNGVTIWNGQADTTAITVGAFTYYRNAFAGSSPGYERYSIYRTSAATAYTSGGAGGIGGDGGRGIGWDGARANGASGAAGAAGGQNAGTGGTGGAGGNGGDWGVAASSAAVGATGTAGNNGADLAGGAGSNAGTGGRAVLGFERLNYAGSGTLVGGTA